MSIINPAIFEINARLLVKRYQSQSLLEIPNDYWKKLRKKGVDYVWLMGVWKVSESSIAKYCFQEELIKEYKSALSDWKESDVAGSPYAVEDYIINPNLGSDNNDLLLLKEKLNKIGIKLILDFIPNHFNSESELLKTNPEIFLKGNNDFLKKDRDTFFKSPYDNSVVFAHGKDPYFPAWTDTIQIDYSSKEARNFMLGRLEQVSELCDGVRCDMSMLILNDVFKKTWECLLSEKEVKIRKEFWKESIGKVKENRDDFIFIAEAYWDREWDLQQLGFDYTYDKKMYDRLHKANVWEIFEHLLANMDFQRKSIRFIENHDEQRALKEFGEEKSRAASVIISTIPGMRFYNDGQFEGKTIKTPVQLDRETEEPVNNKLYSHYYKMLQLVSNYPLEETSNWEIKKLLPAWGGNDSYKELLCWQYVSYNKRIIVVVNYSEHPTQGKLNISFPIYTETITFHDLFRGDSYVRHKDSLIKDGLYIDLHPYDSHFLVCEP